MPTWTSSHMRRAPLSSHSWRAVAKNDLVPGLIPPSPWRGSRRIAASPLFLCLEGKEEKRMQFGIRFHSFRIGFEMHAHDFTETTL